MHILLGTVQLPNYKAYWSRKLQFPLVADMTSTNQHKKLRQNIVDNNAPNNDIDKLFKN